MHRSLLLLPLAILAACDQQRTVPERTDDGQRQAAEAQERKAIAGIETDVRIKTLQAQVDRLEAELSELKDGRQAIDTQLLSQRLTAVEQRVYAAEPPAATPTPIATATPKPSAARTTAPPRAKLKLTLPPPER
ncbi:hypothetical protein ACU5AX_06075 [Sphingomonas sp. XXL09]|uniref:hypothetical protein n=1 Tax=Sphingomonas sp. XXL09 TaxID=3457787 RepID=UPI00406BA1F2